MTITGERPPATPARPAAVRSGLLDPHQLWRSLPGALVKLDPRTLWHNPVMFIVEVGAAFTTVLSIIASPAPAHRAGDGLPLRVLASRSAPSRSDGERPKVFSVSELSSTKGRVN